jgi:RNA polymerase sigma-70 factor, ECF subfamily
LPLEQLSEDAILRLYELHGPALLLFARGLAPDHGAAEDIVQSVFLRLLRGGYVIEGNAAPYLYRAVRNQSSNDRRNRSRAAPLGGEERWFSTDERIGPIEISALQEALAALPELQREVVIMRIWSGMTLEEVADATGVSINTAASRYRYGLEKLREEMGVQGREERTGSL